MTPSSWDRTWDGAVEDAEIPRLETLDGKEGKAPPGDSEENGTAGQMEGLGYEVVGLDW